MIDLAADLMLALKTNVVFLLRFVATGECFGVLIARLAVCISKQKLNGKQNVFHPDRQTPIYQEAEQDPRPMTEEEVADGTNIIRARIPNFEYNRIYARAHDVAQMISLYRSTTSNYEKIQIYRLIYHGDINDTVFKKFVDEVYHIENDNLFQLNPALFPTIPSYIIELCDNGIDILESELTY